MKDITWPPIPGAYRLGDADGCVAVCTLGSDALYPEIAMRPHIAIAGLLHTANLGIEDLVVNVTANPRLRFLVLCGADSPVFKQGQSLRALVEHGIDGERLIVGAEGHDPVLRNVSLDRVAAFRAQIEVVDRTGVEDPDAIVDVARDLATRDPGAFEGAAFGDASWPTFVQLAPGGRREPLWCDPKGFFVIGVDRPAGEIVVRHYERDYTPAHEMRSHSGEAILLGLLREQLVSQLSHAGYLGRELVKAETAIRLGLSYEQDRPLSR